MRLVHRTGEQVMRALRRFDAASTDELAEALGLERERRPRWALSQVLSRLVARGDVCRRAHDEYVLKGQR